MLTEGAATASGPSPAPDPTECWFERRFRAMGSSAHVVVRGGSDELADWAVREVARLEDLWSRFRPGSDVGRLQRRER